MGKRKRGAGACKANHDEEERQKLNGVRFQLQITRLERLVEREERELASYVPREPVEDKPEEKKKKRRRDLPDVEDCELRGAARPWALLQQGLWDENGRKIEEYVPGENLFNTSKGAFWGHSDATQAYVVHIYELGTILQEAGRTDQAVLTWAKAVALDFTDECQCARTLLRYLLQGTAERTVGARTQPLDASMQPLGDLPGKARKKVDACFRGFRTSLQGEDSPPLTISLEYLASQLIWVTTQSKPGPQLDLLVPALFELDPTAAVVLAHRNSVEEMDELVGSYTADEAPEFSDDTFASIWNFVRSDGDLWVSSKCPEFLLKYYRTQSAIKPIIDSTIKDLMERPSASRANTASTAAGMFESMVVKAASRVAKKVEKGDWGGAEDGGSGSGSGSGSGGKATAR